MADDIITLGGPRGQFEQERDEAIEELFHAEYPGLVRTAFVLVGDENLAGQAARQAFLRLLRHWRRLGDPREAPAYLQGTVTGLAREIGHGRPDADGEPAEVDTAGAWQEFEALRARRSAARKCDLTAAVAVTAVAAAVAVAAVALPSHGGRSPAGHPQPGPVRVATYPHAIAAKYQLSGVIAVAGGSSRAWAIRQVTQPSTVEQPAFATRYQLVAIDLRTNSVLYRVSLGREPRAIAAGDGRVWLTTPFARAGGQIVRIDPATGRVVQTLHLRADGCTQLSFTPGHLYAACQPIRSARTQFWTISPTSGRAVPLARPVNGFISSLLAVPDALWYVSGYARLNGLSQVVGRPFAVGPKRLTVLVPSYQNIPPGAPDLAYDNGSIWALGQSEQVAMINAITGHLVRLYTYRNYDPTRAGGLDFLTAAGGWLWFLDDGYPFSGVLRVSEATGRPAGGVPVPPDSCGQTACSLIFSTPGAIWVPTAELLLRIDPSGLPLEEPENHLDADSFLPG